MPGVSTNLVRRTGALAQRQGSDGLPAHRPADEPKYYDLSFLKEPVWKWEIASYFFLGGLSGGAYLIGQMAERFGQREHEDIAKLASFVSLGALLPAPALLIKDLGDPKRFHHMLRVWKPTTPMNLGSWTLTAFSGVAALSALRQWALDRHETGRPLSDILAAIVRAADGPIAAISGIAGIPLAILFSGYTGVLISCTANPLWCKNPWLGPLFTASGVSAAAGAISLALTAAGHDPNGPAHRAIEQIDTAATVGELVCLGGFLKHAGPAARPLTHGKYGKRLYIGVGALVAGEVIKRLPLSGGARKAASLVTAGIAIGTAFSLKWSITYAGHQAAKNPRLARHVSRPRRPAQDSMLSRARAAHQLASPQNRGDGPTSRYSSIT